MERIDLLPTAVDYMQSDLDSLRHGLALAREQVRAEQELSARLGCELMEARAELERSRAKPSRFSCVYCGEIFATTDFTTSGQMAKEHVKTCPNSPLTELVADHARLDDRLQQETRMLREAMARNQGLKRERDRLSARVAALEEALRQIRALGSRADEDCLSLLGEAMALAARTLLREGASPRDERIEALEGALRNTRSILSALASPTDAVAQALFAEIDSALAPAAEPKPRLTPAEVRERALAVQREAEARRSEDNEPAASPEDTARVIALAHACRGDPEPQPGSTCGALATLTAAIPEDGYPACPKCGSVAAFVTGGGLSCGACGTVYRRNSEEAP